MNNVFFDMCSSTAAPTTGPVLATSMTPFATSTAPPSPRKQAKQSFASNVRTLLSRLDAMVREGAVRTAVFIKDAGLAGLARQPHQAGLPDAHLCRGCTLRRLWSGGEFPFSAGRKHTPCASREPFFALPDFLDLGKSVLVQASGVESLIAALSVPSGGSC